MVIMISDTIYTFQHQGEYSTTGLNVFHLYLMKLETSLDSLRHMQCHMKI